MYSFEKEIAKREMMTPLFSYPYKIVPLTDRAKFAFAVYNKKDGQVEKSNDVVIKKHLDMDAFPFKGKATFHYEETEETAISFTKELAVKNMADRWVPGITHVDIKKNTGYSALYKDVDYKIEVGDRVTYKQPEKLTFDDIKAL